MTQAADQAREAANTGLKAVAAAHRFDEAALDRWMASHVDGYAGPLEVRQFRGGQSNPTYQLTTPGRVYVLRRKPPGALLPSAHAVDREYRVISALGGTGFPVPRTYGLCTDQAVIGSWFYVMDKVEGRILWDLTLPRCEPAERRAIYQAQIDTLADLHNTDYAAIGLSDFGKPGNYMGRQLERWARQYRASVSPDPGMERLIEGLGGTVPAQERTAIVHGDYRLDNLIVHDTEPRIAAVLDWELSTLGEPLADFTYFLMSWLTSGIADIADLRAHGMPTVEETVEAYCLRTGRTGLPALDWYFAYNCFRLAAILYGIQGRVRDGTASHPDAEAQAARIPLLVDTALSYAGRAGAI